MSDSHLHATLPGKIDWVAGDSLPRKVSVPLALSVAAGAAAFAALLGRGEEVRAWQIVLVNFLFWSGLATGCVAAAAMFEVAQARWARPLQRLAGACSVYLPVSFLLFLGFWFGRRSLLPWMTQPRPAIEAWLNVPFFFAREAVGLLLLYGLGLVFFYRSALRGNQTSEDLLPASPAVRAANSPSLQKFALALLIAYVAVHSLVAWDFIMALDRQWFSSLFGAFHVVGNLYLGIAVVAALAITLRWRYQLEESIGSVILHNLGKLIFAFSLLWVYLFWSQYLVIWYGNLPYETEFVLLRTAERPWNTVAVAVLILNFLIPFLVLLPRSRKENPKTLLAVSVAIAMGIWMERYLLVVPSLTPRVARVAGWEEPLITLAFFSSFVLLYSMVLSKAPMLPGSRLRRPR
jgi:Ni/Fe-hydrogenase subunit HybB-like protein